MQEVTGDLEQAQSFLWAQQYRNNFYIHLEPDSSINAMRKPEQAFFTELCSTVLKTERSTARLGKLGEEIVKFTAHNPYKTEGVTELLAPEGFGCGGWI